jgi:CheY-like chemotaxis protein
MRKKALYCMPGLCSVDGIDSFGTVAEIENMVRNTIRNVLIVDPNKSILELFRKSIQQMFPSAKISAVQSGEEALRLYTVEMGRKNWDGHDRGFDVVITEEKLSRHRAKGLQPFAHIRMRSDSFRRVLAREGSLRLCAQTKGEKKWRG